jgi:hypothetical protein
MASMKRYERVIRALVNRCFWRLWSIPYDMVRRKLTTLVLCVIGFLCHGCSRESVPEGRILVKNDSQDREFNVISVLGNGKYAILKPGERVLLPPGTRFVTATRRYATYTRRYSVACPPIEGPGIVIKMIDMHTNRMPAGCITVSASKE